MLLNKSNFVKRFAGRSKKLYYKGLQMSCEFEWRRRIKNQYPFHEGLFLVLANQILFTKNCSRKWKQKTRFEANLTSPKYLNCFMKPKNGIQLTLNRLSRSVKKRKTLSVGIVHHKKGHFTDNWSASESTIGRTGAIQLRIININTCRSKTQIYYCTFLE